MLKCERCGKICPESTVDPKAPWYPFFLCEDCDKLLRQVRKPMWEDKSC